MLGSLLQQALPVVGQLGAGYYSLQLQEDRNRTQLQIAAANNRAQTQAASELTKTVIIGGVLLIVGMAVIKKVA